MHSVCAVFSHLWALGPVQPAALRPDLLGSVLSEGVCRRAQIRLANLLYLLLPPCLFIPSPKKQYLAQ